MEAFKGTPYMAFSQASMERLEFHHDPLIATKVDDDLGAVSSW